MFSVLMLEMGKQLFTRVVFDDLLSAFMVDLWLYKATCIKCRMSQIPELWITGYWSCACFLNNCTGTPAVNTGLETGIASISLPSAVLVLHCHEQLGEWILPWIRSLKWQ